MHCAFICWDSLVIHMVKNLLAMQETQVWSLGWEDLLEKEWQPTPVLLTGKFHGQRSLVGYSPCSGKESDTTEHLTLFTFTFHPEPFPWEWWCLWGSILSSEFHIPLERGNCVYVYVWVCVCACVYSFIIWSPSQWEKFSPSLSFTVSSKWNNFALTE